MTFDSEKIVITGCSSITCAGKGPASITEALREGRTFLSPLPADTIGREDLLWGRADGFKASEFLPPLKARKLDRCSQFAVAAAMLALDSGGIDMKSFPPEKAGIALGCGFGGVANSAELLTAYFNCGVDGLQPLLFPNTVSNAAAGNTSIELGMKGPNVTLVQRYCSAESALLVAWRFLAEQRADVMLSGGADDLNPLIIKGLDALRQLDSHACCFSEGAGMLLLERAEHAAARGAAVRGRVLSIRTIGMMPRGTEQEALARLVPDIACYDLISLSGSAPTDSTLKAFSAGRETIAVEKVIGRSLAMGATAIGALLGMLPPGGRGLHLAASPEGPYFAIELAQGPEV